MLNFIAQAGQAVTILDFTSEISSLITGLIGVTWFAAGMITVATIQEWRSRAKIATTETTLSLPTVTTYKQAA